MGLFGRSRDAPKRERRNAPSKEMQDFIRGVDVDMLGNSNSGVQVDEQRAMQTSAVYACVKILAETVASLPLHLYKKARTERTNRRNSIRCFLVFTNYQTRK